MPCSIQQRRFLDLSSSLEKVVLEKRMPYMGVLELTYRCNQSCCHCYCNLRIDDGRKKDELTTEEIKRILDELAEAGCLWLLLSGGEILVREDFWDIYLYALRKGMLVPLFTNATLIDEEAARRFAEFPPLGIDISIYGSNPSLHDSITGSKGSFKKMMDGVSWLRRYQVKFFMKAIVMTLNLHDLNNMQKLAEDLGAEFRSDAILSPRTDGGMEPAKYRLSVSEIVKLDLAEEGDYKVCKETFADLWGKTEDNMLACGGGIFGFNINPYGTLSPCTMYSSFQHPLKGASFKDAWARLTKEYEARRKDLTPVECRSCSMLFICPNCPAWAELEAKSFTKKVNYLCEYAKYLEKEFFLKKKEVENGKKALSEAAN